MKMADVIHLDYSLLPIINRFGIQLGFGDQTLQEICDQKNINKAFLLEILNAFHNPGYFPEINLQKFSTDLILEYLKKTHEYYLENRIPQLESLIGELIENTQTGNQGISLLQQFFNDYKKELTDHIDREEEKVYPYVDKLEKAVREKSLPEELLSQVRDYSIDDFASEHDNVEEKLFDLKNIIIKYLPTTGNNDLCNTILSLLFELEKDLNDHARIEDKILVPKVTNLEKDFVHIIENQTESLPKIKGIFNTKSSEAQAGKTTELSGRETGILTAVAQGLTNQEIAEKLFISTHTVISHRKNITRKLGIKTVAGLTVYAILNNLIDVTDVR